MLVATTPNDQFTRNITVRIQKYKTLSGNRQLTTRSLAGQSRLKVLENRI